MSDLKRRTIRVPSDVIEAVMGQAPVDEVPHSYYKYPARFAPSFAREVIKAFTVPGDTVVDPFCGGGTSLVEAISLGRKAAGFDISSLATFLSRAKTTPLSVHDKREILAWADIMETAKVEKMAPVFATAEEETHYLRNLPENARTYLDTIIQWSDVLPNERQRKFIRLILLAVGQWALDCKTEVPKWSALRGEFCRRVKLTVEQHFEYFGQVAARNEMPRCRLTQMRRIINCSSEKSHEDGRIPDEWLPAKLIVTSPPYPGVHVVYHRWQINGRRETPAPFWLADGRDGAGAAHYCLGRRDEPELKTYFKRLRKTFASVRELLDTDSLVVQLVAFSRPEWQLEAYLDAMELAGYQELLPSCNSEFLFEGRIWRHVPGRKWYANKKGRTPSSKEVMLIHRPVHRAPLNQESVMESMSGIQGRR
jgi:DNA modification methylase